jgi:bifunctional non-homologous end joining protein LigD
LGSLQNVIKEKPLPVENIKEKPIPLVKTNKKADIQFKLTHPEKILYPEDNITKFQIAEYYKNVEEWILPYISYRPLTLLRCPEGYKECFYQKHITNTIPDSIHGITIKEKEGKSESLYIKDYSGLMALPQLGVLEIHPWGSRIEDIESPDTIIFDIDPSPEVQWNKVVQAAHDIRKHLAEFKLISFVKTTGGKGLHVVVHIKPEYDWEEIKIFSHTFVDFLVRKNPHLYVSTMSKLKRKGKIFIDYLRNQRGATAVGPYSTRARLHAPVSTPISWEELTNKIEDTYYTINTLSERLKKLKTDPWENFYKKPQNLNLDKFKK